MNPLLVNVKLSSVEAIKKFVAIASMYEADIDVSSAQYVVDAKSILGIFSLNLDNPVTVHIYGDHPESFAEQISEYKID